MSTSVADVVCWVAVAKAAGAALAAVGTGAGGVLAIGVGVYGYQNTTFDLPEYDHSYDIPGTDLQASSIVDGSSTIGSGVPVINIGNEGFTLVDPPSVSDLIVDAKTGPKVWPEGPHNQTINRRIEELTTELGPDWVHTHGGTLTEEYILTPGGTLSARRPDITFYNPVTGEYYRENVGRTMENGSPVPREIEALDDIQGATGQRPAFTRYD